MPRQKVLIQMVLDGRAVWRIERDIQREYCRRMTPEEFDVIGATVVNVIKTIVIHQPGQADAEGVKLIVDGVEAPRSKAERSFSAPASKRLKPRGRK